MIENERVSDRSFKRRFQLKNNFQMLFKIEIKSTREFLCQTSLLFLFYKPLKRTKQARDHSGHYRCNT